MDYPYTEPFWYVFMTAVLASMTAMILCYGLALAIRALVYHCLRSLARGGHR